MENQNRLQPGTEALTSQEKIIYPISGGEDMTDNTEEILPAGRPEVEPPEKRLAAMSGQETETSRRVPEATAEEEDEGEKGLTQYDPDSIEELSRREYIFREQLNRAAKVEKISRSELKKIVVNIRDSQNLEDIKRDVTEFSKYVRLLRKIVDPEEFKKYNADLELMKSSQDISLIKTRAAELAIKVDKHYPKVNAKENRGEAVKSLQDLMELIMDSEEDQWRRGGKNQLLDEHDKFQPQNFLAWVRGKIIYYHEFDPDKPLNLFSEIAIPTLYKSINLGEMIRTPKYFMEKQEVPEGILKNNGEERVVLAETTKRDQGYDNLRDQILYEAWLFSENHSNDATYRLNMGRIDDLGGKLKEINYWNAFTKNRDRLLRILKLPGTGDAAFQELMGHGKDEKQKLQGNVGKAIRRSIVAYYHIADEEMFNRVLGEKGLAQFYKSVIEKSFKNEVEEIKDRQERARRQKEEETKEQQKKVEVDILGKDKDEFFAKIGQKHNISRFEFDEFCKNRKKFAIKALSYQYDKAEDFRIFNIFEQVKKEQALIETIRGSVAEAVGKAEGFEEKDETDQKYAEAWAFSTVYWTGISARNDVHAIGFDKWSNLQNLKEYRLRQAEGRGSFGLLNTIPGIERVGLNMWEGIKVKEEGSNKFGKTLLEVLQGGEGDQIDLSTLKNFDFEQNAQRQFQVDHITNGINLVKFLTEQRGMNFASFLKRDPVTGRVLIDLQKADETVREGIWKQLRYNFVLPGFDYDKKIRRWKRADEKDAKGGRELQWETVKLEDSMVTEEVKSMGVSGRAEFQKDANLRLARNIFAYLVSKECEYHRQWKGGQDRWILEHFELIKAYFKEMPVQVAIRKNGVKSEAVVSSSFFTNEEWEKHIAARANVTFKRLFFEEMGIASSQGAAEGLFGALGEFIKRLTTEEIK